MRLLSLIFPVAVLSLSLRDPCPIGFGTGTTGGAAGPNIVIKDLNHLIESAKLPTPAVLILDKSLTGAVRIKFASDKTLIGLTGAETLTGIGLEIKRVDNVILRNFKVSKVVAKTGDHIGIDNARKVWVDHVEGSSERGEDKDYYDGLLDITHGADLITLSYNHLHTHWKSLLFGHSDNNAAQDKGKLRTSVVLNRFVNLNSRAPSLRFGSAHVYNNVYENVIDGINTRQGAKVLVEGNVWDQDCHRAVYSTDAGFARVTDTNVYENKTIGINPLPLAEGEKVDLTYEYKLEATDGLKEKLKAEAGATLKFSL